jgi:hypothetical protein
VPIPANEILFHLKHNAGLLRKNLEKYADDIEIKLFADAKVTGYTKPKLSWGLKPLSEIQRMTKYGAVLYSTLKKMYEEGKETAPTAYEVLESWRSEFKNEQPKECKIWVLKTEFQFESKAGKEEFISVKSLNQAIKRLLITD